MKRKESKVLCSELGLVSGIISHWKKKFALEFPDNEDLKIAAGRRIQALEKEVSLLKGQGDILKKAVGITLNL
ncbi:hypothetical protein [Leptospira inadai]|uniref:Transposase n=1 Tax=Leptospira inadai serovar Lyme TaxID=293084 RepID=A0ABX4YDI0_9LEPT|nr:hypothetical protein [Leptospira inadai]PNV72288.1 hypothetical protein BES34_019745 [Leptospira inadai serovar Lyme]